MKFSEFLEGKSITQEAFAKKDAEEMAGLYNEYNEKKAEALETAISEKASKEDIDAMKSELLEASALQVKELNAVLIAQGIAIKTLSKKEQTEGKGLLTAKKGLSDQLDALKELKIKKTAEGVVFDMDVKAMTITGNVSGGNVPVEQRLAGMDPLASRMVRLFDIVSRGTATSNVISWVSQANKTGAAGGTAEGALKNEIAFDLVVVSESVKKRTAFIKVSDEMIDDIDFMATEINNELMRELLKDVENQVYQGDGTGNNLNGIRKVATPFAAGSFAGTVDNANIVDVLVVAMDQIKVAEQIPANYILMHPSDVTSLKLIKVSSTDDRYIDRLQLTAGQMSLDGIPILETTLVTIDQYMVGYFPNATVYDKGAISVEVGLDSDDFTKNLRTVRAEWRGLVIVKTNVRPSFVKGVFTTDKAAIETP